jgi:hypothetical protein
MYNLLYAYAYALSDVRRITLVLMHILIQPPSSYKSSFSYKTSDGAETHDPSAHATTCCMYEWIDYYCIGITGLYEDMPYFEDTGLYQASG